MQGLIPGLKPLWIIQFKTDELAKGPDLECHILDVPETLSVMGRKNRRVEEDMRHLVDIVKRFREILEHEQEEDQPPFA